MVTVRRSTRRLGRGAVSATRAANPERTTVNTIQMNEQPIPVPISMNPPQSAVLIVPSSDSRSSSQLVFDSDGIQYSPYFLTSGDNPGIMNSLTKDQIQGVIAYFNSQLHTSSGVQSSCIPSTSGGTISTLPGMSFSSSTIGFVGILRATGNVLSSDSWIIDSGATHHVCHDKSLFISLPETMNKSVSLPTGLGVKIAGIGQVKLNGSLVLNNVLYIPDFILNLMSVSQLTKDLGYGVIFDDESCMLQDLTKGLINWSG